MWLDLHEAHRYMYMYIIIHIHIHVHLHIHVQYIQAFRNRYLVIHLDHSDFFIKMLHLILAHKIGQHSTSKLYIQFWLCDFSYCMKPCVLYKPLVYLPVIQLSGCIINSTYSSTHNNYVFYTILVIWDFSNKSIITFRYLILIWYYIYLLVSDTPP